jgi:hypothetical protein
LIPSSSNLDLKFDFLHEQEGFQLQITSANGTTSII